jgi:hypothetical protein
MLVFSTKGPRATDSAISLLSRQAGLQDKELASTIADINRVLPDDWRLSGRTNGFRIYVDLYGRVFVLAGHVLHVLSGVIRPSYLDPELAPERSLESGEPYHRDVALRLQELSQPNLYYFAPTPDDSGTPLFGRQHEKICVRSDGTQSSTQYHRIHPIYPWGLDMYHYRWVSWDVSGRIKFVDFPCEGYHAKDYWVLPRLEDQLDRLPAETYVSATVNALASLGIQPSPAPPLPVAAFEREFKFALSGNEGGFSALMSRIQKSIGVLGLVVDNIGQPREQIDTYLDDSDLTLFQQGASFRARRTSQSARVTLKTRMNDADASRSDGMYFRGEEEVALSPADEARLLNGEPITAFPFRLVCYVAPHCSKLRPIVTVRTMRRVAILSDGLQGKVEICFDSTRFRREGTENDVDGGLELEIESKGLPADKTDALAGLLQREFELQPSPFSKYERAVTACELTRHSTSAATAD